MQVNRDVHLFGYSSVHSAGFRQRFPVSQVPLLPTNTKRKDWWDFNLGECKNESDYGFMTTYYTVPTCHSIHIKMACEQFGYSEHQMGSLPSVWTTLLMVTLSNNNLEDALWNCEHIYRYTGINIAPLLTLHFKRSSFRHNSPSH